MAPRAAPPGTAEGEQQPGSRARGRSGATRETTSSTRRGDQDHLPRPTSPASIRPPRAALGRAGSSRDDSEAMAMSQRRARRAAPERQAEAPEGGAGTLRWRRRRPAWRAPSVRPRPSVRSSPRERPGGGFRRRATACRGLGGGTVSASGRAGLGHLQGVALIRQRPPRRCRSQRQRHHRAARRADHLAATACSKRAPHRRQKASPLRQSALHSGHLTRADEGCGTTLAPVSIPPARLGTRAARADRSRSHHGGSAR